MQFELLAARNGWYDEDCAIQVTNLKGAELEVSAQLDKVVMLLCTI